MKTEILYWRKSLQPMESWRNAIHILLIRKENCWSIHCCTLQKMQRKKECLLETRMGSCLSRRNTMAEIPGSILNMFTTHRENPWKEKTLTKREILFPKMYLSMTKKADLP